MKIVVQNSAVRWAGNEKSVLVIARALRERGHDVVFSCTPGEVSKAFAAAGFRVTHVRPRGAGDVFNAIRFARWLRTERPDALLLTSRNRQGWGAWAGRRAHVPRIAMRMSIVRSPRVRDALPFLMHWVDVLIVNANAVREHWLRTAHWLPSIPVEVVHNPIETYDIDREAARATLRAEIGDRDVAFIVGAAGRLEQRKGFDMLVEAAAALERATVVIAGDGTQRAALEAQASALHVEAVFLGQRSDVPRILAGCDVCVVSSRNEGVPNVLLEAIGVGTPVIASAAGGVADLLAGFETSAGPWLVTADTPALTRALREAAAAIDARPQVVLDRANQLRDALEARFTTAALGERYERILRG